MTSKEEIITKTRLFVKKELENEATGHDWWHIQRVVNMAKNISKTEGGDEFIIEVAALLHDISDYKLNNGDEKKGIEKLETFLNEIAISPETKEEILNIINGVSYKGAGVKEETLSVEGKIVQDADRLDAMGAIGIARTFAYGGNKNRAIYSPNIDPKIHTSFIDYKSSTAPTINHFYEKLLLLKNRMNTKTAKKIAKERHQFMEDFLTQFYSEWNA